MTRGTGRWERKEQVDRKGGKRRIDEGKGKKRSEEKRQTV